MTNHLLFDRSRLRHHRDRAASAFDEHDFLFREMSRRLADRLLDFTRDFPAVLDLGAHTGLLADEIQGRHGINSLVQMDLSPAMLSRTDGLRIVGDEEFLPFAENSFDLVLSAGSLHWVNDLPGALIQIHRILKPEGLFMAVLPGGETLSELRQSLAMAEMDLRGGLSPRISPFLDVRDAGSLLQRAGFALPVADSERLNVSYTHPLKLMRDLRGMGEANALIERTKSFTPCSLMMLAADHYLRNFSTDEGRITATFELVTMTGWKL